MFLLLLCVLGIAQAQDTTPDYVDITAGETAPYTGKLFTSEALAKMLAQHQTEIDLLNSNFEYEIREAPGSLEIPIGKLRLFFCK